MIRGGDFYAVWVEEKGIWSTNEQDVVRIVDREVKKYAEEYAKQTNDTVIPLYMKSSSSGMIDKWHKYVKQQMRDTYKMLDEKIIFENDPVNKQDYASKRLPYPLLPCDTPAYDRLISTLYSPENRLKIEWAIGAIVTGDSKKIQKFLVFYGKPGSGKSTILSIIDGMFEGYCESFDSKALGDSKNQFALEAFSSNPLVAIEHEGNLSKIEDNTRINSLVSHDKMRMNEKFMKTYTNKFKTFIILSSNHPVKITDAKSGLLRRLIDVNPSGEKIPQREYDQLVEQVKFEYPGIAYHCRQVYLDNKTVFNDYVPVSMMSATNDFYNFVADNYLIFKRENQVTLGHAWELFKNYCDDARVPYPMQQRAFKEELKNYFEEFYDRTTDEDGSRVRSVYKGFKTEIFEIKAGKRKPEKEVTPTESHWLDFKEQQSIFDKRFENCFAQYGNNEEKPFKKWENVTTTLKDLNTSQLHYILIPEEENLITVDFDIPDEDGNKSFERNFMEACNWPPTYAELSKSGAGIHLEYFYIGDPNDIAPIQSPHIEVKISKGNASLRRKLTKCNSMPIATISSGLKRKEKKLQQEMDGVMTEKGLITLIERNLRKEIHNSTASSVSFISKLLDEAQASGLNYDLTKPYDDAGNTLANDILEFAKHSTNQSDTCEKLVYKMKMKSADGDDRWVIFDIEVYPNLLLICWKYMEEDIDPSWPWEKIRDAIIHHKNPIIRMYNPTPGEVALFLEKTFLGFNNRKYDNHILYGRSMGYSIPGCYKLSQDIIIKKLGFFREAYGKSKTDVFDFANAGNKKSLKKLEIDMGAHHQEMGLDWNKDAPEELWGDKDRSNDLVEERFNDILDATPTIGDYCDNDVLATEMAFWWCYQDWITREILAKWSGMTVNDTTNTLVTRIIFGTNRRPQSEFNYRFMGYVDEKEIDTLEIDFDVDMTWTVFMHGKPVFPGYTFENGESWYRDEKVGEGGYVYSEPGMYGNVALLDIASMHPSSIKAEELFGPRYTKLYWDIVEARLAIKHGDFDKVRNMFGGIFAEYLEDESKAEELANALKIPINSVYGLTSAGFDNPFKDPRNVDNIVAKRGALFMINLKHEVQSRGYKVAHIKTDSIKIPDATPEIIKFVTDYGKLYGYNFEHECTYDRLCLTDKAIYIAKYASVERCIELYGESYVMSSKDCCKKNKKKGGKWDATGATFAVPYIYKKLFTGDDIEFKDLCETKAADKGTLYLDMNENLPDVTAEEKALKKIESDYRKGLLSDTTFEELYKPAVEEVAKGHNYIFTGKVGLFCPIVPGAGGGELVCERDGKYYAVQGTKKKGGKEVYRFLETEMVERLGLQDKIDYEYFEDLVEDAVKKMSEFGDVEEFRLCAEPYKDFCPWMNLPEGPEVVPFD